MSSKSGPEIFRTLTFRLTLWYTVLFTILSLTVFMVFYYTLASSLMERVDSELTDDAREMAGMIEGDSPVDLQAYIWEEVDPQDSGNEFYLVLSPEMELLASTDLSAWEALDMAPPMVKKMPRGETVIRKMSVPGREGGVRILYRKLQDGRVIQMGFSTQDNEELLENLRGIFGITAGMVLLLGGVLGWFMARRAMSGVERVRETAVKIGEGDLKSRVPVGGEGEEINNLARAFNEMLERIDTLIREMKEVTHNIAHDLRGPITRIRGISETTLASNPTVEDYQEMVGLVIDESDRLISMVNILLEIAETETGVSAIRQEEVDMGGLAREAFEIFLPVAEDKGVRLDFESVDRPLRVRGEAARLQRAVANVLDNAIKFTPEGGWVRINMKVEDGRVLLSLADSGIGIDEENLPLIFNRFYRGDQSRSKPGNGLGLSLAIAIIQAHGGEIEVESRPGEGSLFTIILPESAPAS